MQSIKKSLKTALIFTITFLVTVLVLFVFSTNSAKAAELGKESPLVYCTYLDQNGEEVDGNKLVPGTYDVNFNVRGVSSLSTLQITAKYDTAKVAVEKTPVALMSDDSANAVSSMGEVIENGNIVFGFVSDNADSSTISSEGTLVATVKMTFTEQCDAADVISFESNPNLTFLQVSYADGFDDAYALDDMYPDYNGSLYLMSGDVSPSVKADTYDVSGQIKIATDVTGTNTTVGIIGINVRVEDSLGATIAQAVTDKDGYYTLTGLPAGEYKMTISGSTTIDREVTLVVSESKKIEAIGIVICDYNKDGFVNSYDTTTFIASLNGEYDINCDYNGDESVNTYDTTILMSFVNESVVYDPITV